MGSGLQVPVRSPVHLLNKPEQMLREELSERAESGELVARDGGDRHPSHPFLLPSCDSSWPTSTWALHPIPSGSMGTLTSFSVRWVYFII